MRLVHSGLLTRLWRLILEVFDIEALYTRHDWKQCQLSILYMLNFQFWYTVQYKTARLLLCHPILQRHSAVVPATIIFPLIDGGTFFFADHEVGLVL